MCGIAGIYNKNSLPSYHHLQIMALSLSHRGPDGEKIQLQDNIGLVHRRLSIIDLQTGDQPLKDSESRLLIVNGEIYNYLELKKDFPNTVFHTQSDCEVILPLYGRHGVNFTSFLRGMYALALYDPGSRTLMLARDLFGMKQLYYAETSEGVIFASEPQALLATGLISSHINEEVRTELLQLRYSTTQKTIFNQIERVLPGETILIRDGEIIQRYQQEKSSFLKTGVSYEKALDLFEESLQESVHLHLRSDVPYGLFLSGGLDSASLLAFMQRETKQPLKTYTVGFKEVNMPDECPQAARLSKLFNTHHTEVTFSEEDFWSLLPQVMKAHDDPVFDAAMLPTFKLAQVARKEVKVILCGEGGDEILGGYRRYQKVYWPKWLGGRIARQNGVFDETPLKTFMPFWRSNIDKLSKEVAAKTSSKLQAAQLIDLEAWMPNNLLIKLDRCLMAHGLEGRTPYLDYGVFTHLFSLPDSLKIRRRQGKWILRKWLEKNLLEAEPFAKKRGFSVPVQQWMGKKASLIAPLVAHQAGIIEFLPPEQVIRIFSEGKNHFAAWVLLAYAVWHQAHIIKVPCTNEAFSFLAMRG
jgi:asparagine synthase (glutamine-hydrolysing)